MKKYLSELIGTFILVFVGTGAIMINDIIGELTNLGISLSFGLVVMVVIYSIGDISGAHINPAVTIAFWISRRFNGKHVIPYILFQIVGAIFASLILYYILPEASIMGETLVKDNNWLQSFVLEFIITFILMFVILNVSTESKKKRMVASFLIGSVVFLASIFVGPITGASMNPARTIGPAVFGESSYLWVYLISTILGSISSVYVYKMSKLISFKRKV